MNKYIGFFTNIKDGQEITLWDDSTLLWLQSSDTPDQEVSFPYPHDCGYGATAEYAEMIVDGVNEALLLAGHCLILTAMRDSRGVPKECNFENWEALRSAIRNDKDGLPTSWDTFVLKFCKL